MLLVRNLVVWLILAQGIAFAADAEATPAQTFRIGKNGNGLLVPVNTGAGQRLFWFDTGANISVFDASLKGLLRSETRRSNLIMPNATQHVSVFAAPPMSLGTQPLRTVGEVLCVDLQPFREACAEPIFGFLGMDAVRTMIVRIDFDSGALSVLPSLPDDLDEPLELVDDRGIPCVRVRVCGRRRALFSIDTGAPDIASGELESHLFNSLLEAGTLSVVGEGHATTIARTSRARVGRVADLRIGRHQHFGLIFQESSRNSLHLGFLSRYVVVFDFPKKRMYLSPGKRLNDRDRRNLSGLHVCRIENKTIVESVDDRGAAQRAGLRAGDILLSIDQTAVDSLPPIELLRMLGTPSTRRLTLRRGDATIRCALELREARVGDEAMPPVRRSRRAAILKKLFPGED